MLYFVSGPLNETVILFVHNKPSLPELQENVWGADFLQMRCSSGVATKALKANKALTTTSKNHSLVSTFLQPRNKF